MFLKGLLTLLMMRNLINLFEDDNEIEAICDQYGLDYNKVTINPIEVDG